MRQLGECVATATAMYGKRPETFAHRPAEPPAADPFESLQRLSAPGPGWIERYDLRFADGSFGWRGEGPEPASSKSTLWIAADPPRPMDFVDLAALTDIFFGRIIHVRKHGSLRDRQPEVLLPCHRGRSRSPWV